MGDVQALQILQTLKHLSQHLLNFIWRNLYVWIFEGFVEVAFHEIETEVEDGGFVVS